MHFFLKHQGCERISSGVAICGRQSNALLSFKKEKLTLLPSISDGIEKQLTNISKEFIDQYFSNRHVTILKRNGVGTTASLVNVLY
jgi:hypothetical protein